ncbi:MAG: hypothetical protein KDD36_09990 [Flavobacteriales bacterium]|nr:hypothetical protein [Flavobacteriales bacterium]
MSVTFSACKKDKKTPVCDGSMPTYNTEISVIIQSSCMGSSCHGAGSKHGEWTSYTNLKPQLDNGGFKKYVLEKQSMPKGSSLSQEQLNMIQCWVDNGYPEK